jgi:hypothetical protein
MTRRVGNLRTLGVLPCGECRAFVSRANGCEHYVPPSRRKAKRALENIDRFDSPYAIIRLAEPTRMRVILERAARESVIDVLSRNDRRRAGKLRRAGLLTLTRRGGDFAITPDGLKVWARVLALQIEGR